MEAVADPIAQLKGWVQEAFDKGVPLADAVALATTGKDNKPDVRFVLVKDVSEEGLVFYTHFDSPKSLQMRENPNVALVYFWTALKKQVRARGVVSEIGRELVANYFATRPRDSQLSAWASRQSRPMQSEKDFHKAVDGLEKKYHGDDVPLPEHWVGYVLAPLEIEFWIEGKGRMHQRLRYFRDGVEDGWEHEMLYP